MAAVRVILSCILLVALAASTLGQENHTVTQPLSATNRPKPIRRVSKDTKYVSCFSKGENRSRTVRSPILISADGLHRAYVEVEASAFWAEDALSDSLPSCSNTSRLFIAGPENTEFRQAYVQEPPNVSDGNSLKLVDWSPDGTELLMERTIWGYETEGEYSEPLLFAINSSAVTTTDIFRVLAARFGKDCSSENSIAGFLPNDDVVIAVTPVADTYYNEGASSCVKHKTLVALDGKHGLKEITRLLPIDSKPQHYGHFLENNAKK